MYFSIQYIPISERALFFFLEDSQVSSLCLFFREQQHTDENEWSIGRNEGTPNYSEKNSVPLPLSPPLISGGLTLERTWASVV